MTLKVGIDLGTTNCCLASPNGQDVVVFKDEMRSNTMPSIVAQDKEDDTELLVGLRARLCDSPRHRYSYIKRSIGTNDSFELFGKPRPAYWLSGQILSELAERARSLGDEDVAAVITVPAHFEELHLQRTRDAAEVGGLKVLALLREPIAAAIAYYHDAKNQSPESENETILVYDFGGGTFDATVCTRREGNIDVGANGQAYSGNKFLGGVDIDKVLVRETMPVLKEMGLVLSKPEALNQGFRNHPWLWKLILAAERLKKELSQEVMAQWKHQVINPHTGDEFELNHWMERDDFNKLIDPLIQNTLEYCDTAMQNHARFLDSTGQIRGLGELLKLGAESIDRVILVGGSSRIPYVRQSIASHFEKISGRVPEIVSFKPDESVAMGAAIYAQRTFSDPSAEKHCENFLWLSSPPAQVPENVETHPPLQGVLQQDIALPVTISLEVDGHCSQITPDSNRTFRFKAFPLKKGDNAITVMIAGEDGEELSREEWIVSRSGMAIGDPGLARAISVRVREGLKTLVPKGTQPKASQKTVFYIRDDSGRAVAPLYEGHNPIGRFTFNVPKETGVPVTLITRYEEGKLTVNVKVGDATPSDHQVELETLRVATEKDQLVDEFIELKKEYQPALDSLPESGEFSQALRKDWDALVWDIQTELENPAILDVVRIADRISALRITGWKITSVSSTVEGLQQRLSDACEWAKESGADINLMNTLDEIATDLNSDPDSEQLFGINERLLAVQQQLYLKRSFNLTREEVEEIKLRNIQIRLDTIKRYGADDPNVKEYVAGIEIELNAICEAVMPPKTFFNRLWEYEYEFLNPLYSKVVVAKRERGLLGQNMG